MEIFYDLYVSRTGFILPQPHFHGSLVFVQVFWLMLSLCDSSVADPAILKRGGSNYMLPFKCIDRPKKKGGPTPGTLPPGSATEL